VACSINFKGSGDIPKSVYIRSLSRALAVRELSRRNVQLSNVMMPTRPAFLSPLFIRHARLMVSSDGSIGTR
jgi:hypothetical protein